MEDRHGVRRTPHQPWCFSFPASLPGQSRIPLASRAVPRPRNTFGSVSIFCTHKYCQTWLYFTHGRELAGWTVSSSPLGQEAACGGQEGRVFWREGPLLKVTWASWGTWAFGITRGEEGAKNNVPSESWHMVIVVFFQKLNCILDVLELLWAGSPITLSRELLHNGSIRFSWLTWKPNHDYSWAGVFSTPGVSERLLLKSERASECAGLLFPQGI